MKNIGVILCLLLFAPFTTYAQVGINTIDPQEALHVNGKIRVTDTDVDVNRTMVSIIGIDDEGTLNKINLSVDFVITNNTITTSGTTSYSVLDVDLGEYELNGEYTPGYDIVDFDLGIDNINAQETVIRFLGQTEAFDISGIQGGVAGRHLILLNSSSYAMGVIDESNDSIAANRILTYGSNTASTEGQGAIELVYDGTRWILINIRD